MTDYVPWLRKLAAKGGKGVVGNIDARSLGRIADEIEQLRAAIAAGKVQKCSRCSGRGYLVADAELDPYPVQCPDCKPSARGA